MGNNSPNNLNPNLHGDRPSKLTSELPINSTIEEECMLQIVQRRSELLNTDYICTVQSYELREDDRTSRLSCMHSRKLVVSYGYFDYCLANISIVQYSYSAQDICYFIYCIAEALNEMSSKKMHHGDISFENIVRKGQRWQLVDKIFLKNGINAYEKVLEGESGFISPSQMEKIRLGFVRDSPEIEEADDIFSLGMVALQLACRKPSRKCYRESFIRFKDNAIQ